MKQKICFITGSRAEYGLLKNLIFESYNSKSLATQVLVTGSHLSKSSGFTVKEIEEDGIAISARVEIHSSQEDDEKISQVFGRGVDKISDQLEKLKPNLVVLLGDRYEILSAAISCMLLRIPIAHIHGGETTEGVIDEAIRHSITKMSYLHFVACDDYKKRVIQLGEDPSRVFNYGAMALDSLNNLEAYSKEYLENYLGISLEKQIFLVTVHPETLNKPGLNEKNTISVLSSIKEFKDDIFILNASNADEEGSKISEIFKNFSLNNNNSIFVESLGQRRYLSLLRFAQGMIGNSSSGILEMPFFKRGSINIGDRQRGRKYADSVVNTSFSSYEISQAIKKIKSKTFNEGIMNQILPFGSESPSPKIIKVLEDFNLMSIELKKSFYDLQ